MMPCVNSGLLKLISSPTLFPESLRYVKSWASWTGRIFSTDFNFDDYFIIHPYVDLVSAIELKAFVRDRKIDLALKRHTTQV